MKVGIVGSRTFNDYTYLKNCMDLIHKNESISVIVSGGAIGADTLAEQYAEENGIETEVWLPDYKKYDRKVAPIIRNTEIVHSSDIIVAFWDGVSRGTMDTIKKARKQNKQVIIFRF